MFFSKILNFSFKRCIWWAVSAFRQLTICSMQSFPFFKKELISLETLCVCGCWWLTEMWHHTDWLQHRAFARVCMCTKRFSVQSSSVVTRQSIWEMKTCTPVTCCVQCFLGAHYFWINLCWWQFHCLLLWWYYYGAFILLLFCVG